MSKLFNNRHFLGLLFMLPAGILLLLFLTYPLGLGTWLGFTDAKIGRAGEWVGIENFKFLVQDSVARLSLFNTLFYTVIASILKFALGLWLALLLNRHMPFKSFIRAIVLLPFIVPTALSAIAFWWLYDAQFSVLSWVLVKMGLIKSPEEAAKRQHTPKIAYVARPADYTASSGKKVDAKNVDLLVRAMSMGKLHHAMMGTASVAIATAAAVPGTLVNKAAGGGERNVVRFGHPSGTLRVGAEATKDGKEWVVKKAIMSRSARVLMEGWIRVPGDFVA